MTRLWTDGAEMGDVLFWDVPNTIQNLAISPRSGTRHFSCPFNGTDALKTIPNLAEFYVRWPILFYNGLGGGKFLYWSKGATILGALNTSALSRIEIRIQNVLKATGTISLQLNTYYSIEVHVKIDSSAGVIEVKIDGVMDVSFYGNTQPTGDTAADSVGASCQATFLDDLACNDTTGGVDDSWCGDGKVIMLRPNAPGDVTQLTPSAGANWECVDECPPNTTDYVSSATGGLYDLYNCDTYTLQSGEVVRRVQVEARCLEESALGDSINLGVKTESAEYFGASQAVLTSYRRYVGDDLKVNPNTSAAWTQLELDALQVGVTVV